MADQADYGSNNNGTTLVPGALICYRHFGMSLGSVTRLSPMHDPYGSTYVAATTFTAGCTRKPRYKPTVEEKMGTPGTGCGCSTCRPTWEKYAEERKQFFDEEGQDIHTPPVLGCSCGFYAHYDPATDFYREQTWGPGADNLYSPPAGIAIVRAVVEMTGTTVMGRRGVRAQTMRIVGLSVDWKKYRARSGSNFWFSDPVEDVYGFKETVEIAARQAAYQYDARLFGTADEMYAAYPKADISALGVEEAPPEVPRDLYPRVTVNSSFDWKTARAQLAHYLLTQQSHTGVTKPNSGGGTVTIQWADDASSYRLKGDATELPKTPMERAIKAKKNRPAPPGTGIDYRKKDL